MLISSDCYAHSDDLEAATTLTAEVALALAFEFGSLSIGSLAETLTAELAHALASEF